MIRQTVACVWISVVAAQAQSLNPPGIFSGFLHDRTSGVLRPLLGVPGSAYAGPAVTQKLDKVWTSGAAEAIAVREDATVVLTALDTATPREHVIEGILAPERAAWSPRGMVAVLYSARENAIQRVMVKPELSVAAPVAVGFAGPVTALAVDETGNIAFAAGDSVYLLRGSEVRTVASGLDNVSLVFGAAQVLYAGHLNGITEFRMSGPAADSPRQILEGRSVAGLAFQSRTRRLFALEPDARRVLVYDGAGAAMADIAIERTPSTFEVLRTDSVVLLNGVEAPGSPAIVLDIENEPAVFFIPAGEVNPA